LGNFYARLILSLSVKDVTSGFLCFRRQAWLRIKDEDFLAIGFPFLMELKFRLIKNGASWQEVPINFVDRKLGETKFNFKILKEGLILPWKIRRLSL
jgi:dolichol-phosphate mannosyltransferase